MKYDEWNKSGNCIMTLKCDMSMNHLITHATEKMKYTTGKFSCTLKGG